MEQSLDRNIKVSLYRAIKKGTGFRWGKILGYNIEDVKKHLETFFDENMNWENYGSYWGITFFIPRRLYNFTNFKSEEFRKCWSLKNLKPQRILECYRQKASINMDDVDRYNLYDILPVGKIRKEKRAKD